MIPCALLHALLQKFKADVCTQLQTDVPPSVSHQLHCEKYFEIFYDLINQAEDDLGFIHDMIERDPDCHYQNRHNALNALIDYINILIALYEPNPKRTPLVQNLSLGAP